MKTGITIFLLGVSLLLSVFLRAQKLTYREVSGDEVFHYDYDIGEADGGLKIQVVKRKGDRVLEDQLFLLNKQMRTRKWVYIRPADNTDVTAVLKGNKVYLNGVRDGKKIEEDEDLDEYPWIQLWPMNMGLEPFLNAGEEEIKYWAYGTEKPGDLELAKFVATKQGKELIKIGNEEYPAYRVNITLSGWRSMFWEGNFYFRQGDWRILLYDGEGAPGKPDSKTTLIKEY